MSARCSTHPEIEAAVACPRCGAFLCSSCSVRVVTDSESADVCATCRPHVFEQMARRNERISLLCMVAFLLAILGPLTGWLAVILGRVEWRRIQRGESKPTGRAWAGLAIGIGSFWCVVAVVVLLGFSLL